jgi:transposase
LGQTRHTPQRASRSAHRLTYIFAAICPKEGKGAALVLPRCDTGTTNLHLAEIATAVAPGCHAVLLVDQAGRHMSDRLVVPTDITIFLLPPKCPELNPVDNIWRFMRKSRVRILQ